MRPLWSSCPQSNNNRSPLKTQDHLFIDHSRSGLQPGGISFSKLQKVGRPSITPVYFNLHKGRFVNPGLKNITFCILLRIRQCSLPDMLASLSINARSLVPPAPGMISVTKRFIVLSHTDNICNPGWSQQIGDFIALPYPSNDTKLSVNFVNIWFAYLYDSNSTSVRHNILRNIVQLSQATALFFLQRCNHYQMPQNS
ncbi:hypothetical protein AVEN_140163-1 [Araneus ventricosus]|uniref:Uncharacterized protein n=1 Tax=Araneus ventricosus TaxID=182803 RepID=A0A4Y2QJK6_ARAVE|nr:hypothetical protein AVEN_140163-1 [Araneus ventricosus]